MYNTVKKIQNKNKIIYNILLYTIIGAIAKLQLKR